ncbi:hypothetical protein D3C87_1367790 [compost metagenome]
MFGRMQRQSKQKLHRTAGGRLGGVFRSKLRLCQDCPHRSTSMRISETVLLVRVYVLRNTGLAVAIPAWSPLGQNSRVKSYGGKPEGRKVNRLSSKPGSESISSKFSIHPRAFQILTLHKVSPRLKACSIKAPSDTFTTNSPKRLHAI